MLCSSKCSSTSLYEVRHQHKKKKTHGLPSANQECSNKSSPPRFIGCITSSQPCGSWLSDIVDVVGPKRVKRAKRAKRAPSGFLVLEVTANEVTEFPRKVENPSERVCEGKARLMFLFHRANSAIILQGRRGNYPCRCAGQDVMRDFSPQIQHPSCGFRLISGRVVTGMSSA